MWFSQKLIDAAISVDQAIKLSIDHPKQHQRIAEPARYITNNLLHSASSKTLFFITTSTSSSHRVYTIKGTDAPILASCFTGIVNSVATQCFDTDNCRTMVHLSRIILEDNVFSHTGYNLHRLWPNRFSMSATSSSLSSTLLILNP
jgi:hypothetical protein